MYEVIIKAIAIKSQLFMKKVVKSNFHYTYPISDVGIVRRAIENKEITRTTLVVTLNTY